MSLFTRFFYKKPADGLLEFLDRVYIFDSCFSTEVLPDGLYNIYLHEIVTELHEEYGDSSFLAFNFREGEKRSQFAEILCQYDVTIIDYPHHFEGCPLLPLLLLHHFLRVCDYWLSLRDNQNVILLHCERGGWPLLAFLLACFLTYRKLHSGDQKTLDVAHREAPKGLLRLLSPLNPLPSQLRYLQYVARRNITPQWPPVQRALSLDCLILRGVPSFDSDNGCRPLIRISGQNIHKSDGLFVGTLCMMSKKKPLRRYQQDECDVIKIDIQCLVQGDVVLECAHLDLDPEKEVMMFRIMFNTAFIRSNILMLNYDDVDTLWDAKDQFPKGFRAEVLFGDISNITPRAPTAAFNGEVKGGLPIEAFAKVQELFNGIEWLERSDDDAFWLLKQISTNALQEKFEKLILTDTKEISTIQSKAALQMSLMSTSESDEEKDSVTSDSVSSVDNERVQHVSSTSIDIENELDISKDSQLKDSQKPTSRIADLGTSLQVPLLMSPSVSPTSERNLESIESERPISIPQAAPPAAPAPPRPSTTSSSKDSLPPLLPPLSSSMVNILSVPPPPPPPLVQSKCLNPKQLLPSSPLPPPRSPPPPPPHPPPPPTQTKSLNSTPGSPSPPTFTSNKDVQQTPPPPPLPTQNECLNPTPLPPSSSPLAPIQTKCLNPPPPPSSPLAPIQTKCLNPPPPPPALSASTFNKNLQRIPPPPPPPPPSMSSSKGSLSASPANHPQPPIPPPLPTTKLNKGPCPAPPLVPPVASTRAPLPPPPPPPQNGKGNIPHPSSPLKSSGKVVPPPPPPVPKPPGVVPPPPPPLQGGVRGVPGPPQPPGLKDLNTLAPPSSLLGKGRLTAPSFGNVRGSLQSIPPKKTSLKALHWVKVTRATQGSLWADSQKHGSQTRAPEIDLSELENLFSATVATDERGRDRIGARCGSGTNKSEIVHLIDMRRANNCEIMLTKIKMPLPVMITAVLALDSSVLDIDQVENLIKFCPTKEEMEMLKNYTGNKEMLGPCEQFFMELMKVPRVESKLRVFSFTITFSTQVNELQGNLKTINDATREVKESSKLRQIMQTILTLGNALNQGTARGSAIGFRLDSLLKLSDTRARNNKMTLMHYLCKLLAEKMPELLDFDKDLIHLEAASKIQLKIVAEEMQAVSKGLEKVEQELNASGNDGDISMGFRVALKGFLDAAEADVRFLASLYSEVGRNADSLSQYFGEDPARCPFEQVTSILVVFVNTFKKSREENERNDGAEKRKTEKEALKEKSKTPAKQH